MPRDQMRSSATASAPVHHASVGQRQPARKKVVIVLHPSCSFTKAGQDDVHYPFTGVQVAEECFFPLLCNSQR